MTADLEQRLRAGFTRFTPSEKAVASWVLANITRLPFETASTIADAVGVSQMTVGRFLRSLGYNGLSELKRGLRAQLGAKPVLISDRVARIGQDGETGERLGANFELEVEALLAVYEQVGSDAWTRTAERIANAGTVFVAGFQTLEGIASSFVQRLDYLRPDAHQLDGRDGTFAELLAGNARDPALILLEMRRYTRVSRLLVEAAAENGIGVTIICDPYCTWAHEVSADVLVVSTDSRLFWDNQSGFVSLLSLLLDDVARALGAEIDARAHAMAALQNRFGSFEG